MKFVQFRVFQEGGESGDAAHHHAVVAIEEAELEEVAPQEFPSCLAENGKAEFPTLPTFESSTGGHIGKLVGLPNMLTDRMIRVMVEVAR